VFLNSCSYKLQNAQKRDKKSRKKQEKIKGNTKEVPIFFNCHGGSTIFFRDSATCQETPRDYQKRHITDIRNKNRKQKTGATGGIGLSIGGRFQTRSRNNTTPWFHWLVCFTDAGMAAVS
jgi:hypothetical protein